MTQINFQETIRRHNGRNQLDPTGLSDHLQQLLDPADPLRSLASYIRSHTDAFAIAFDNQLLMAEKTAKSYTFPNDDSLPYSWLTNEVSANMPLSTLAFCLSHPSEYFVRSESMADLEANLYVRKAEFPHYTAFMPLFPDHALAIVLSHEHAEANLTEEELTEKEPFEIELLAEAKSFPYLQERGIPQESYELFHKLRKTNDQGNISRLVLQNLQL
jgi:hypothetical protein